MDFMVVVILTSSRPQSNVCVRYVQCMHANIYLSGGIQEELVPVACVIVYPDRRCCYSCFIVAGDINSP
jgi:hypothetical protein